MSDVFEYCVLGVIREICSETASVALQLASAQSATYLWVALPSPSAHTLSSEAYRPVPGAC